MEEQCQDNYETISHGKVQSEQSYFKALKATGIATIVEASPNRFLMVCQLGMKDNILKYILYT